MAGGHCELFKYMATIKDETPHVILQKNGLGINLGSVPRVPLSEDVLARLVRSSGFEQYPVCSELL